MCFLLFVAAFAVRFFAADYGYFHGDERINEAAKVLAGQLVPGQHFYPPFINYLNAVALGLLFVVGKFAGWWAGTAEFRAQYFTDPTVFYVTARMVTALTGALLAPLFYGVARAVGVMRPLALAVGAIAVVFPLGVFMAHIAKGDTGLATALVAVFWVMLRRLQGGRGWDWSLGLAVVLALSFKHSAVFVLAPLALGVIVLLAVAEGVKTALVSFGRAMAVILVLWPVLNIGILLDLRNFLDYQKIQAVMSLQSGGQGAEAGLLVLLWRGMELIFGMNPVLTAVALLTPLLLAWPGGVLQRRVALGVIWVSLMIGTVLVAVMAGPRQPEHLWIANFAGFLLLDGLVLAGLAMNARQGARLVGAGLLAAALGLQVVGSAIVLWQAAAVPIQRSVGDYLAGTFGDRKVLTSMALVVPQMKEAQGFELARMERLAQKYQITLPEMAEERIIQHSAEGALFYVNMPGVMYGLEGVEDGKIDYEVKAHAWPLQPEEWQLEYWLEQGFSVFAVQDFDEYAYRSEPQMRQEFFQQMAQQCRRVQVFEPRKRLFLEREVVVFDCAAG